MIVPDGYTEEQVMTIVETVVKRIAPGFTFGYYDRDDMIQEGYVELIKNALPKYNGSHPLENFLSSHLKKRMLTLIRDKFHRNDPPCKQCPLYNKAGKDCTEYKNMLDCDLFGPWKRRNMAKQNLMQPAQIEDESFIPGNALNLDEDEMRDILLYINKNLDPSYRADFFRLLHGSSIPKVRKDTLFVILKEIFNDRS
jgi:hypothetical protein